MLQNSILNEPKWGAQAVVKGGTAPLPPRSDGTGSFPLPLWIYALLVWASKHKTYLTKLHRLQNKALRIISKTCIRDSISSQYHRFKVLNIDDLFTFENAKIMRQFTHKTTLTNFDT